MSYKDILASFEADEIDFMSALELTNCGSLIDLYERVADEDELNLSSPEALRERFYIVQ